MKSYIKKIFAAFGYRLLRISERSDPLTAITSLMQFYGAKLMFDVGANRGQFASALRNQGYSGTIISFEPLIDVHTELLKKCTEDDSWIVHPEPVALGDQVGYSEINVAGNSVSSSILAMHDAHLKAAPKSAYQSKQKVPIVPLDDIYLNYLSNEESAFLKIDTQGYELQVLQGAKSLLGHVSGVLVELSFLPLYEGQALWLQVIDFMDDQGFELWDLVPGFRDSDGRLLQADGVFIRKDSRNFASASSLEVL